MFLSFEGYSQEFLGKAYYMSKSTVNMDWMKNMSPDRQKYMKARMKTALEKNYILDFDSKPCNLDCFCCFFAFSTTLCFIPFILDHNTCRFVFLLIFKFFTSFSFGTHINVMD